MKYTHSNIHIHNNYNTHNSISHQLFLHDFCIYAVVCCVNDAPEDALRELCFRIESVLSRTAERVQILLITTNGERLKPNEAEAAHKHLLDCLVWQRGSILRQ